MQPLTMDDLARLLGEAAGIDPRQVTPEMTLHDLGIESREVPRLLLKLEQVHNVKVSMAGLAASRDMGDFHRLVVRRQTASGSAGA